MERDQLRGSWGWGEESHVRRGHWSVARPQCPQPSAPAFSTFLGEDLSHSSRSDQNRMVSLVCPPWRHPSPIPVHFLRFCIFLFDQTNGTVVPISPSHPALDHIFSNSHRPGQFPCSLPRARYRQAGLAHLCQGLIQTSQFPAVHHALPLQETQQGYWASCTHLPPEHSPVLPCTALHAITGHGTLPPLQKPTNNLLSTAFASPYLNSVISVNLNSHGCNRDRDSC